jgi:hypothetical protein
MDYVYAPRNRITQAGAGPDGYTSINKIDGRGPFGTITYPRALTKNEIEEWGLSTIEMPRVNYHVFGVRANGNMEHLLLWSKEMPGAYDAAAERAKEIEEVFEDYAVTPAT